MFDDNEQHQVEAQITRREAMKKIGKYGVYVPATLAVLTAAPRAFAQSATGVTVSGVISCAGTPTSQYHIALRLDSPSGPVVDHICTPSSSFTLHAETTGTGTWYLTQYSEETPLSGQSSGAYPGNYSGVAVDDGGNCHHCIL